MTLPKRGNGSERCLSPWVLCCETNYPLEMTEPETTGPMSLCFMISSEGLPRELLGSELLDE